MGTEFSVVPSNNKESAKEKSSSQTLTCVSSQVSLERALRFERVLAAFPRAMEVTLITVSQHMSLQHCFLEITSTLSVKAERPNHPSRCHQPGGVSLPEGGGSASQGGGAPHQQQR